MEIYVDADACPVKDEVMRVAERHGLQVHMVANSWMRLADSPLINRVLVEDGPDVADDWIAEHAAAGDIVVTNDIPLASRCLKVGACAVRPNGKSFTDANIGMALAMRDLMSDLRETGEMTGGPSSFSRKDRSDFLQELERLVQANKRSG